MKPQHFCFGNEAINDEPYHYRTAGLEGIYLLNGYEISEYDGERTVAIKNVDGLHKAIGRHIVCHRKGLTPKETRFLRNTLGLTQGELAALLGTTSQSVARWEKGDTEMPGAAEKLLRILFLALTDGEGDTVLNLITSKLEELDSMDELSNAQAQFGLFDSGWEEKKAA
ncbi:helix-turn-helix domain-containing protein [Asticcacaulis endophyticus]|uniref:HTH cro/C1-type domain-containing protein n=1 Tax=Asticcacaulis endophyticus TaxID=1395890 RepID=A0A918UN15_9CAUL|nr:helix-turn-helix domain-containing protein [Asticcacaulis endophyticus]GGZ21932.1 hypothetical protein GCM10011273_03410 [Asticcacaulis endophyticus]